MAIQKAIQKSGILSPWRNPLDPGDRFYRRVLTRAIMNFNGTPYATLSEPASVQSDGDFEIELLVVKPSTSGGTFLGGESEQESCVAIDINSDVLRAFAYDASGNLIGSAVHTVTLEETQALCDSRIHSIILKSSSGSVDLLVDNVLLDTRDWSSYSGPLFVGTVMARDWTGFRKTLGNVLSTRVWNNGDRNTGELVTDLRFDEPESVYQRNYAVPAGVNFFTEGGFEDQSDWLSFGTLGPSSGISNGEAIIERTGSYCGYYAPVMLEAGKSYLFECDAEVVSGSAVPSFSLRTGTSGGGDALGVGSYTPGKKMQFQYTADATITRYITPAAGSSAGVVRFSNISIREWSGAILENVLPGDWEEISKKVTDDFWLGENLYTQYVWENPFSAGDQWTYEPSTNTWLMVGDGELNPIQLLQQSDQPTSVLLKYKIQRLSGSGSAALTSSPADGLYTITDEAFSSALSGIVKGTAIMNANNLNQSFKRRGGVLTMRVSKPSMYRYLEYAEGAL